MPLSGRALFGMLLTLVISSACGAERSDSRDDSSSADSSAATAARDTAVPPETLTSSTPHASPRGEPRSDTATSRRRAPAARPPAPGRPRPSPSGSDVTELRGTITVVGNAPVTQVMLGTAGGGSHSLTGPELPSLRRAAGLEVVLRGSSSPGGELVVRDFTVVSADGQPALDGVLEHEGSTLYLRTADRRIRLGNPPNDLHALVGARVWLTGAPEGGPHTFGVITPAR